jgi:hypothetical protein
MPPDVIDALHWRQNSMRGSDNSWSIVGVSEEIRTFVILLKPCVLMSVSPPWGTPYDVIQ